jgi:hypothetical protein
MGQKQETTFARFIHKGLPSTIYIEKTSNPFRAGTPDYYIEGPEGILWIEYKWINKLWTEDKQAENLCSSQSWIRQLQWLKRAESNDVNNAVIIGVGLGRQSQGYFITSPYDFLYDQHRLWSYIELRNWIKEYVT